MTRSSRPTYRVEFNYHLEREALKASRSRQVPLPKRRIRVDGYTYTAFSADHLLEWASDEERARPGHIHG